MLGGLSGVHHPHIHYGDGAHRVNLVRIANAYSYTRVLETKTLTYAKKHFHKIWNKKRELFI